MNKSHYLLPCDICGFEEAQVRRITRSYGSGIALLVIENIPVVNCLHCGESYFEAENDSSHRSHQT